MAKLQSNYEMNQEFRDVSRTGKDRRWSARKALNVQLSDDLAYLQEKDLFNKPNGHERVRECARILRFGIQPDNSLRLSNAWFCKNKLCPMCNWRRSLKHGAQISVIIDKALKKHPKARFLFLTLTIKNVDGNSLGDAMKHLTKSFDRLFKRKKVKNNMLAYLRATEVTYNEFEDTYHPHLHILMMVKSTYFKGKGENYISQDEWQALWKQSAKLDYDPQVNIQAVKPRKKGDTGADAIKKAVVEVAKYPVKPVNDLKLSDNARRNVVDVLSKHLKRKRQISYGGLFKEIFQEMNVNEDDLVKTSDDNDMEKDVNDIVVAWMWERKKYYRIE